MSGVCGCYVKGGDKMTVTNEIIGAKVAEIAKLTKEKAELEKEKSKKKKK